jgi:hypothetical protein
MGVPLVHLVADIHSSVVVPITALNSLARREKGKLLEDVEKLEHHDLRHTIGFRSLTVPIISSIMST